MILEQGKKGEKGHHFHEEGTGFSTAKFISDYS